MSSAPSAVSSQSSVAEYEEKSIEESASESSGASGSGSDGSVEIDEKNKDSTGHAPEDDLSKLVIGSRKGKSSQKPKNAKEKRLVVQINNHSFNKRRKFPNNKISTTKYNIITFLPKNLFEQFRRFANFYFLVNAIVALIPGVSPVDPFSAIAPLLFVLGVSAIKEIIEDLYRYRADRRANSKMFWVVRQNKVEKVPSRRIRTGDILKLERGCFFPADVVVLSTSASENSCYVETSNLDGETNLKVRKAPPKLSSWVDAQLSLGKDHTAGIDKVDVDEGVASLDVGDGGEDGHVVELTTGEVDQSDLEDSMEVRADGQPGSLTRNQSSAFGLQQFNAEGEAKPDALELMCKFVGEFECEAPSAEMYRFEGRLVFATDPSLSFANLPHGNSYDPGKKEGLVAVPLSSEQLLLRGSELRNTQWVYAVVAYTGKSTRLMKNQQSSPLKFSRVEKVLNRCVMGVFIWNFIALVLASVGAGIWQGMYGADAKYMYDDPHPAYTGLIGIMTYFVLFSYMIPISLYVSVEIVRMCQAKLMGWDAHLYGPDKVHLDVLNSNLNEELGQIRYVFADKTGTLTENMMTMKRCVIGLDCIDSIEDLADSMKAGPSPGKRDVLGDEEDDRTRRWMAGDAVLRLVSLCHTVVPERPMENVHRRHRKVFRPHIPRPHRTLITSPFHRRGEGTGREDTHRSPMASPALTPERSPMASPVLSPDGSPAITPVRSPALSPSGSVVGTEDERVTGATPETGGRAVGEGAPLADNVVYQAQSPDEGALVLAARNCGYAFADRRADMMTLFVNGELEYHRVLAVLEFTSARRCMSVLCRDQNGIITLYSKGADVAIRGRLRNSLDPLEEASDAAVRAAAEKYSLTFAREGLRVLWCASRRVEEEEFLAWEREYDAALESISTKDGGREARVADACAKMECDLELLGCTAVEDRLQFHVPETIRYLIDAGVNVWVLTGDKQETAINIAYASQLLSDTMTLLKLNAPSQVGSGVLIKEFLESFKGMPSDALALIVDGDTLSYVLRFHQQSFLELSTRCRAVVCCRISPLQKALVVRLVKRGRKAVTLAVGDGANDVSMIREAHVGVGLTGLEGTQAARASDFAIARFHHLRRLLCVHGRFSYVRLTGLVQYSLYKNMCFAMPQLFFAFFCAFSGQTLYESWVMTFFNVVYTFLPPLFYAVLERDVPPSIIRTHPALYKSYQESTLMNWKTISVWMVSATWHSAVIFWGAYMILWEGTSWFSNGQSPGLALWGTLVCTAIVIVVNVKMLLESLHITWVNGFMIFICPILYLALILIIGAFPSVGDYYWVPQRGFVTQRFWFAVLALVSIAILPDIVVHYVRRQIRPTLAELLREQHKLLPRRKRVIPRIWNEFSTRGDFESFDETDTDISGIYAIREQVAGKRISSPPSTMTDLIEGLEEEDYESDEENATQDRPTNSAV